MMLGSWGSAALGIRVDLAAVRGDGLAEGDDFGKLFSETGAYLLEVAPGTDRGALAGVPHAEIGIVTAERALRLRGAAGETVLRAEELEEAWGRSFARVME
jgi:hypothetical protein